jgi:hypothetical protein
MLEETFDEACQHFSKFLGENHCSEHILWVDQTDVVWDRHQVWILVRPIQTAIERARKKYEAGAGSGFGVALLAFSDLAGYTVETIILPKDDDEAQRFLMPRGGLKLSARLKKFPARAVANPLIWLILSTWHRKFSRSFRVDSLGCS